MRNMQQAPNPYTGAAAFASQAPGSQQITGYLPVSPIGPATQANSTPVSQLSAAVYTPGTSLMRSALPAGMTFTLDNSAGVAPANFLMFDASDFFSSLSGITTSPATSTSAGSVAGAKQYPRGNQMKLKGFNYQVTVSAAQFANNLKLTFGDIDGDFNAKPILTQLALRNTQFNPLLQTFECDIYLDANRGLLLTVDTGETVVLGLFLEYAWNRF